MQKLTDEETSKSKIISVMNSKGGCGKTSLAIAIGMYLARFGNNVLFFDNDSQCNLTQRLGINDDEYLENRTVNTFIELGRPTKSKNIVMPVRVEIEKLRPINFGDDVGFIGIIPGSHESDIEIRSLSQKFSKNSYQSNKDLKSEFLDNLNWYKKYFNYIIIDNPPASEGSPACELSASISDSIVVPVDGIEGAIGIPWFLRWIDQKQSPFNVIIAHVKYQKDAGRIRNGNYGLGEYKERTFTRTTVHGALVRYLDTCVCINGIKDLSTLKYSIYDNFKPHGNRYDRLCNEIYRKIENETKITASEYNQSLNELTKCLIDVSKDVISSNPIKLAPFGVMKDK